MAAARHRAGLGTRASCSRRRHGGRSMEYGLYRCRDPAVRLADLLRRAARLAVDMARDAVQAFGGFWFTAGRSGRGHLWLSQASGCGSPAALPTPLGARHRAWRRPGVREVRPGGAVRFMLASRPRTQGRRRRRHPPHHLHPGSARRCRRRAASPRPACADPPATEGPACLVAGDVDPSRLIHPHIGIGCQPPGHVLQRLIQIGDVGGQQRIRVLGQAQRGQRVILDRLPLRAVQQPRWGLR